MLILCGLMLCACEVYLVLSDLLAILSLAIEAILVLFNFSVPLGVVEKVLINVPVSSLCLLEVELELVLFFSLEFHLFILIFSTACARLLDNLLIDGLSKEVFVLAFRFITGRNPIHGLAETVIRIAIKLAGARYRRRRLRLRLTVWIIVITLRQLHQDTLDIFPLLCLLLLLTYIPIFPLPFKRSAHSLEAHFDASHIAYR